MTVVRCEMDVLAQLLVSSWLTTEFQLIPMACWWVRPRRVPLAAGAMPPSLGLQPIPLTVGGCCQKVSLYGTSHCLTVSLVLMVYNGSCISNCCFFRNFPLILNSSDTGLECSPQFMLEIVSRHLHISMYLQFLFVQGGKRKCKYHKEVLKS